MYLVEGAMGMVVGMPSKKKVFALIFVCLFSREKRV